QNPEVVALRVVFRGRLERLRIVDHRSVRPENKNRSHVLGRGGPVEQHELSHFRAEFGQGRKLHAVDDGLEGQVVKFEVAVDFRTEEGDDVRRSLPRLFAVTTAAFPQDCSDNNGKSDGDDEAQYGEVLGMTEAARRQMVR